MIKCSMLHEYAIVFGLAEAKAEVSSDSDVGKPEDYDNGKWNYLI